MLSVVKGKVLTLSEKDLWRKYLNKFPDILQDVYFLPEYYQIYENDYRKIQCFVYESGDKLAIYPYIKTDLNKILKFDISGQWFDIEGAYGYGGVIANCQDCDFLKKFAAAFTDFCRQENIIAEFIRFNPVINNRGFSSYIDADRVSKNIVVDLSLSSNSLWMNSYEHCARKNINKAKRSGLTVECFLGGELSNGWLDDFLNIYQVTMDRNKADSFHYFDRRYFDNLRKLLAKNSLFFFALLSGRPISCEVVAFGERIAYSFLGGTLEEYYPLRPNNLLKHEIIGKLKSMGLSFFCLGGGTKSEDGIYNYKKSFSKKGEKDFYIGKKIHNAEVYRNICDLWEKKYPEKADKYKNYFLKYKF